jgi:hypothetical protein
MNPVNEHNDKSTGNRPVDSKPFSKEQLHMESDHNDGKEEYAAELAVPYAAPIQAPVERQAKQLSDTQEETTQVHGTWLAYTALVLGILSMFALPALFGSLAALLGVISFFQGNRALGVWSVILGLISLAGYFLLVPLYA